MFPPQPAIFHFYFRSILLNLAIKLDLMKSLANLWVVFVLLFSSFSYGQNWQAYYETPELKIEIAEWNWSDSKYGKDHERFIFKYTNLTNSQLSLSFQRKLVINGDKELLQEKTYILDLKPGEELSYFSHENDKTFYLFRKDNKGLIEDVLTDFELRNFNTNY